MTSKEKSVFHVRGGWTYEEREQGGHKKLISRCSCSNCFIFNILLLCHYTTLLLFVLEKTFSLFIGLRLADTCFTFCSQFCFGSFTCVLVCTWAQLKIKCSVMT